ILVGGPADQCHPQFGIEFGPAPRRRRRNSGPLGRLGTRGDSSMYRSKKPAELPIPGITKQLADEGHADLCEQVERAQNLLASPSAESPTKAIEALEALMERCDHWLRIETALRAQYRAVLAFTTCNLGKLLSAQGRFSESVPLERRSITLCSQ